MKSESSTQDTVDAVEPESWLADRALILEMGEQAQHPGVDAAKLRLDRGQACLPIQDLSHTWKAPGKWTWELKPGSAAMGSGH